MTIEDDVLDQAITWRLRLDEGSVEAWHDFTLWLEAAPEHGAVFDRLALDDALLPSAADAFGPVLEPANDDLPAPRRRFAVAGWGVAAAAVLAGLLAPLMSTARGGDVVTYETRAGVRREVRLPDGTVALLNGGSRMTIDRANPRMAMLERGQALMTVRHDDAHPFELHSGGVVLRDVGTVFDVARDGARMDVQVGEGAVLFQPGAEAVMLKAGSGLVIREDAHRVTLTKVAAADVGGWRTGHLSFSNAPLASVVGAVTRATGANIALEGALAAQPFTGSFAATGDAATVVTRLAQLTDGRARRVGDGWALSPAR